MKYPVVIAALLLGSLSATAQIERPSMLSKSDSGKLTPIKTRSVKLGQKERLEELDLSAEQKVKIKEIRQAGKSAKEIIENNADLNDAEKKKQLRILQKDQAQKIQAILSEEQKAKFRASKPSNP